MYISRHHTSFRYSLALGLIALTVGLGGCSLPGSAAPTPAPTATPPPSAAPSLAPTAVAAASASPSVAPASPSPSPAATASPSAVPTVATPPTVRPATPTSAATPATPVPPTVTVPPTVATPVASTQTLRDATLACEMSVPANYVPAATPGTVVSADGKVRVALQALTIGPTETLDDLTLPFVGAFIPTVNGYEQVAIIRLADSLRIDFRGGLPQPGAGTLYFKQFGATICAATIFIVNDAGIAPEALVETLITTLRPRGVGYWQGWSEG